MRIATLASPLSQTQLNVKSPISLCKNDSSFRIQVGSRSSANDFSLKYTNNHGTLRKYRSFSTTESSSTADEPDAITEDVDIDEVINVGVSDVEEPVEDIPTLDSPTPLPPPTAPVSDVSEIEELKQSLFDSFYGTDRGFRASGETRGEIAELVTQLEALNPTPSTTEAIPLLEGKWILAYTSSSELFPLLAAGILPLVSVGEISQSITPSSVQNAVTFSGPLGSSTFTTNASYEIRSSKRLQVKFEEGVLEPPQISSSLQLPNSVEIAGQTIELTPFQGVIRPLEEAASTIARLISGQPPIKIPFPSPQAQSWLLTTFLDGDLRISRGDGGSLFLLVKEGSSYAA